MLIFYPNIDERLEGSLRDRIAMLLEAAQSYKAVVLGNRQPDEIDTSRSRRIVAEIPRDQLASYNWDDIAHVLNEIKTMPEVSRNDKIYKADLMTQLAEVYEVLRAAKMPKLEAVRQALIGEAKTLQQQSAY